MIRRYERSAVVKSRPPPVTARWLRETSPRKTAASHNAPRVGLCNDHVVRTTVLIVDDHEAFRESAGALLEAEGFDVVGSVADGRFRRRRGRAAPTRARIARHPACGRGWVRCCGTARRIVCATASGVDLESRQPRRTAAGSSRRPRSASLRSESCRVRRWQSSSAELVSVGFVALVVGIAAERHAYGVATSGTGCRISSSGWILIGCGLLRRRSAGRVARALGLHLVLRQLRLGDVGPSPRAARAARADVSHRKSR